jgi:hypothetical protein
MATINELTVEGNLVSDPEMSVTTGGLPVAHADLALDATDLGGRKTGTIYLSITGFFSVGEKLAGYRKGARVLVSGKLDRPKAFVRTNGTPGVNLRATAWAVDPAPVALPSGLSHGVSVSPIDPIVLDQLPRTSDDGRTWTERMRTGPEAGCSLPAPATCRACLQRLPSCAWVASMGVQSEPQARESRDQGSQVGAAVLRALLNKKLVECDDALISLYPSGAWQHGRSAAACKSACGGRGVAECGDDVAEFQARISWVNQTWLPSVNAMLAGVAYPQTMRHPDLPPLGDNPGAIAS